MWAKVTIFGDVSNGFVGAFSGFTTSRKLNQIVISETSCKRPGRLREVPLYFVRIP